MRAINLVVDKYPSDLFDFVRKANNLKLTVQQINFTRVAEGFELDIVLNKVPWLKEDDITVYESELKTLLRSYGVNVKSVEPTIKSVETSFVKRVFGRLFKSVK